VESLIELGGAVLILSAFVLAQVGRLETASLPYMVLNLVGAGVLAVVAGLDGDTGFLLLETVWACVSAYSLAGFVRRQRAGR
jgi:hypothetical protein